MGATFGQILPLAIGIALSPLAIFAVIVMMVNPRGKTNGVSFLVGWFAGLILVGAVVLYVSSSTDASGEDGSESTLAGVVKLALGVAFLLLAVWSFRSRPSAGEQPKLPTWMLALDSFKAPKALVLGGLLSSVKPKNLVLLLAASTTIAASTASSSQRAALLVGFAIVASLSVAAPVVVGLAAGGRAVAVLTPAKDWLAGNNSVIMAVVLLIFGGKLVGDGISILLD